MVEVMVVIVIISIIATIATPYFQDSLHQYEANNIQSKIYTAIKAAKTESFIRHQNVIMCLANQQNQCNKNAQTRLIVFTDKNNNHLYNITQDTLLSVQALNLDYGHVYLRAANRHYVKFFADSGLPRGHFGHIKYCPNNISNPYKYIISFNKLGGIKYKPNSIHPSDCPK